MKKSTPQIKFTAGLLLAFTLFTATPSQAQIAFPDDVSDETPAAPIDGFLGLGVLAGLCYGVGKLRK